MAEIAVLLSEEQSKALQAYVYQLVTKSVADARRDAGMDKPFLNKKEAAAYIPVSETTLNKWIHNYGLPVHIIEGVSLVSKKELIEFVLNNGSN